MRVPSTDATRWDSPREPGARSGGGATLAVVADLDDETVRVRRDPDRGPRGTGVLRDVGQGLRHDEVGDGLDGARRTLGQEHVQARRHRRAGDDPRQGRVEPSLVEHRGVQAADEAAQLGQRLLRLVVRLLDGPSRLGRRVGRQRRTGHPEVEGERGEALLGAVVEVALDPAALGVGGVDDPGTRLLERGDPRRELLAPRLAEHRPEDREVERAEPAGRVRGEDEETEADGGRDPDAADPLEEATGESEHLRADPGPERRRHEDEAAAPAGRDDRGRGREQRGTDERVVRQLPPRRRTPQPGQPAAPSRFDGVGRRVDDDTEQRSGPRAVPAAQPLRHEQEERDERDADDDDEQSRREARERPHHRSRQGTDDPAEHDVCRVAGCEAPLDAGTDRGHATTVGVGGRAGP